MRQIVTTILEVACVVLIVAGLVSIACGVALIFGWWAFVAAGLEAIGLALFGLWASKRVAS